MVYKHLMFELLPYGATINITCTSSSKVGELVNSYNSDINYTTSSQQIGLNNCYFLFSDKEPVQMTYNYTKGNGKLVEIITNLDIITNNNIEQRSKGRYRIINNDWINSGNGSFTISNKRWFDIDINERPDPYIRLCFNEVRIDCCFVNVIPASVIQQLGLRFAENGWKLLANTTDDDIIKPVSILAQNYCELKKYIIVSWNKRENNGNLFQGIFKNENHWFQGWFSYGNTNGSIQNFEYDNSFSQRIWSVDQSASINDHAFNLIVPKLDGTDVLFNNKKICNYFKIGYTINFYGEPTYQQNTIFYVDGNNYTYDSNGFMVKEDLKTEIKTFNNSPEIFKLDSENWTTQSTFYKTNEGRYISPASGLEIYPIWETENYCFDGGECSPDGGDCNGENECGHGCDDEQCSIDDGCDLSCSNDRYSTDGYPQHGYIIYNGVNIVDFNGNKIGQGYQGQPVTIYGYTIFYISIEGEPVTPTMYYHIGNGRFVNFNMIHIDEGGGCGHCDDDDECPHDPNCPIANVDDPDCIYPFHGDPNPCECNTGSPYTCSELNCPTFNCGIYNQNWYVVGVCG